VAAGLPEIPANATRSWRFHLQDSASIAEAKDDVFTAYGER